MVRSIWLAIVASSSGAAPAEIHYDCYIAGIRIAELTVHRASSGARYSIRKKDRAANRWGPVHTAAKATVASDTTFRLAGAIRNFPALLDSVTRIDWRPLDLVGWPNRNRIYERHRKMVERVAGVAVTATYWASRDATRPADLVIGPDGHLVAAIDVSADIVLVRRGYERFTTVARWHEPGVSQATYGYRTQGKQMVPMADGTRLATLVYLPDGAPGPFPVVFVRTPYGIGNLIEGYWHYVARGYAAVFQATRGTSYSDPANRSEGTFGFVINEPRDGAAALEWIANQPWSNGRVCMHGGSYVGYTQWAAAMSRNPVLRCLVPESSMGTVFSDQPYVGGALLTGMTYAAFWMLEQRLLPGRTWSEVLRHRPLIELDDFALGRDLPQWNTIVEHSTNDEYWAAQDWYRGTHPREFSALMISGWWDDDLPGTEANWALMSRHGVGPQRLILGPWKHGFNLDRMLNGYQFGVDALRDDLLLTKQRWYDYHLKGLRGGVTEPPVRYFVLGSNEWRTATAWPPPEADPQQWYLHSDGQAHRNFTSGRLTRAKPTEFQPPDRYRYDPASPPANWMSFDQMIQWTDVQTYPYDMKDIEARPDVLTFTSAPLDEELTIAGELSATLYASTDVKDTDWWIHVSDVDPEGRSNRITQGVIRARFRHNDDPQHRIAGSNFETERLLSGDPTEVVEYRIGIRSIANTFRAGHRIRVAIMNALDNYTFPNSNTGKHEAYVTETVVGSMAVHHTNAYPSSVTLPVIKRRR
jgi:putative CocE/NonD family hydrolase